MPTDAISRQSIAITCQSDPLDEDAEKKVPFVASTAPSTCFEAHDLHSLRITSLCQPLPYPTLTSASRSSALLIRRDNLTWETLLCESCQTVHKMSKDGSICGSADGLQTDMTK
jgi:hypothetical protein